MAGPRNAPQVLTVAGRCGLGYIALLCLAGAIGGCHKKKGGTGSPAVSTTASQPPPGSPVARTDLTPVVVQPAMIALSVGGAKDPATTVVVSAVTTSAKTRSATLTQVSLGKIDAAGRAAFVLKSGQYQVDVIGAAGRVLISDAISVPQPSAGALALGTVPAVLVSVPSRSTTIATQLRRAVINANPDAFDKGYIDYRLIKSTAEVLRQQGRASGRPISPELLGAVATQVATRTAAFAAVLIAKGAQSPPLGLALDSAQSAFASINAAIQAPAVQGPCVATPACSVNTAPILAAATKAAGAAAPLMIQSDNPAAVVSALPPAQAATLLQPLLEATVLSLLGSVGNTAPPDAAAFAAGDKALLAAVTVAAVTDVNAFVAQLSAMFSAADPKRIPPASNNVQNAFVAVAQGRPAAAMASIRAAAGLLGSGARKTSDKLLNRYLKTFQAFAGASAGAAVFSQQLAELAATTVQASAAVGSATTFAQGGACRLFAALGAGEGTAAVGAAAIVPDFCYPDVGVSCDGLGPNLATQPVGGEATTGYCAYVAFKVGPGPCSTFAALPAEVKSAVIDRFLAGSGAASVPGLCAKDSPASPCSAWHLADDAAAAASCAFVPPPPYQAAFTALGAGCALLVNDLTSLGDPDPLYALVGGAKDQQIVCSGFVAPADGWPASCDEVGATADVNLSADAAGNCIFSAPAADAVPAFNQGDPCSTLLAADPAFLPIYVSSLSLASPLLCTGFAPTTAVPDCAHLSTPADKTLLQLTSVAAKGGPNCVLDAGTFALGTDGCAAFQALPAVLRDMYVQATDPGKAVCASLGGAGAGLTCADLYDGLVADNAGGCKLPLPEFALGDTCAAFHASVGLAGAAYYASALGGPDNLQFCANAAGGGITDCATIDPRLVLDAGGNCALPTPAYAVGKPCSTFAGASAADLSGYVATLTPERPTLCIGFAPSGTTSACSDLGPDLRLDGQGNCGVAFATFTLGDTCANFAFEAESVRQDTVNNKLTASSPTLCTDVAASSYGSCTQLSAAGGGGYTQQLKDEVQPDATTSCVLGP